MPDFKKPLTRAQVALIEPKPFEPAFSYMRHPKTNEILLGKDGEPLYKKSKREWSFEGVHQVYFDDGTIENRPGRYVQKLKRP